MLEQRFKLTLRVHNANDREIVLNKLHFQMLAGEDAFASGESNSTMTIAKNADTLVEVEGKSRLMELFGKLSSMLDDSGKLHYRVRGTADIQGYGTLPFDRPAELDAAKLLLRGGKH